jgi:DNA polymerase III delta prime subunit
MNIFLDGEYVAHIVVSEDNRDFDDADSILLAHLKSYLQQAYLDYLAEKEADRQQILAGIIKTTLENSSRSAGQILVAADGKGWRSTDEFVFLCINLSQLDIDNMTGHYSCRQLEKRYSGSCAFEYGTVIALVVNLTVLTASRSVFLEDFQGFLNEAGFKAGCSLAFYDLDNLAGYYRQAEISLQYGMRTGQNNLLDRFEDCRLNYLLEQSISGLSVIFLCHEELLRLQQIDQETGSKLFDTLRHYLLNNKNGTHTAKQLFIHRQTLFHRLGRIRKLTKINWDSTDDYLYLLWSLRLLDTTSDRLPVFSTNLHFHG